MKMEQIRNIYCVGRNYRLHAAELGNKVPDSPMIFMKPTHAAVRMDGGTIHLPGTFGTIHYEAELVIRIGSAYYPGMKAEDAIESFAIGIDFTLRELQENLKQKQHPWLQAKGFRSSAPISKFHKLNDLNELAAKEFTLRINEVEQQRGQTRDMIFNFQTLIDAIGEHYGLNQGDLIFTGTPAGVGQVHHGDHFEVYWGDELFGDCLLFIV